MNIAKEEVLVPVVMANGSVDFLPLAERYTPTFLIVVRKAKVGKFETSDPNQDRVSVGAVTVAEAVGKVLMANPSLCYADIVDHMEV